MATKKQKREQAMARRAEFEAKVREDGLTAQRRDQQHRAAEGQRYQQAVEAEMDALEDILADYRSSLEY